MEENNCESLSPQSPPYKPQGTTQGQERELRSQSGVCVCVCGIVCIDIHGLCVINRCICDLCVISYLKKYNQISNEQLFTIWLNYANLWLEI